jgi:group I intron endonuclease
MNHSGVYLISGPRIKPMPYIGKTFRSFNIRSYQHKYAAENGYKGCRYLYNAIAKYGWNEFDFKILHVVTYETHGEDWKKIILQLEEDEIREKNTMAPNGYNLVNNDPSGGREDSEETRLLRSLAFQGEKNPRYGKPGTFTGRHHSDETKEFLKQQRLGIELGPYTEAHKQHISDALKGKPKSDEHKKTLSMKKKEQGAWAGENNPMFGKSPSEEHKHKMRLNNSKPVEQWTRDGSRLIATFPSVKEASEKTGSSKSNIGKCANAKAKTAGGFVWKYTKSSKL